jgi:uncharacterized membrane protein
MSTALWIVQGTLAAIFLVTGTTKLTQPRATMAAGPMSWAQGVSDDQFRAIGLVEVLGALGLVLPAALKIAPILTPIAATGLAVTMVAATVTHLKLGERNRILPPLILLLLVLLVAIERFGPHSI